MGFRKLPQPTRNNLDELFNIQLFRERLSSKRGKAYATMSKVIMGNGGFYGCLQRGGMKLHKHVFVLSRSLLLNRLEPQSSKARLLLPVMPIGIVVYAFTLSWDNLCRNSCIVAWCVSPSKVIKPYRNTEMIVRLAGNDFVRPAV